MASSPTALVLGAGIMGLSAAWALARQGFAVRVVEQDAVPNPRGASVDHHRLIRHAYGAQAGYMRMVDPAYAAWDAGLAARPARCSTCAPACSRCLGQRGGWLGDSRAALAADGRAFTDLTAAEVAARFPIFDRGRHRRGLPHGPRRRAAGASASWRCWPGTCAARGVVFERARAAARGPGRAPRCAWPMARTRSADLLVVAAGPWAPRLLPGRWRRACVPSRQVAGAAGAPPRSTREAWARAPMLLDLAEDGGFYAVPPVAGTPLKIGDHRFSRTGDAEADPREATPAEAEAILALARPRLRDMARLSRASARAPATTMWRLASASSWNRRAARLRDVGLLRPWLQVRRRCWGWRWRARRAIPR